MRWSKSIAAVAAAFALFVAPTLAGDVDFVKEIKPIFERTCLKCHGPEKPKGGLRLDTHEGMTKGAKSGKVLVPGNAEESRLFEVLTLEKDDPDRMPAEGELLNKLEQELFKDWINQGAKWPENLVLTPPAGTNKPAEPAVDPGVPISDAEKAAVAKVQKLEALAMRLAQNTNLLRVDFSLQGKNVKDDELAVLKDMANLVELNLGGTTISDAGAGHLKPLTNLIRLQLHKTKITDAGLANLKGLPKLTILNLYGTEITDAGLEHLKAMTHLERVTLKGTKVTAAGLQALRAALPAIQVER